MDQSRSPVLLAISAAAFTGIAIWLVLDNPTGDSTSLGDYLCAAPYDTALNDADNVPGGEPPADADAVEAQCIDAGETRFVQGLAAGGAAVILGAAAAVLAVRARTTRRSSNGID